MKKLGIIAIIVGAILLILGIVGFVVLKETDASGEMLDESLAIYEMMGLTATLSPGEQFILNLTKYRVILTVLGVVFLVAGIGMLIMSRSSGERRPAPARASQQRYNSFPASRAAGSSSPARTRAAAPGSQPRQASQTLLPYREDRCCICNRSLDDGHAVLFQNEYGAEARIDSVCYDAIHALGNSEDEREVQRALDYIKSRLRAVDPIVAKKLRQYIQSGEEFLYQGKEE